MLKCSVGVFKILQTMGGRQNILSASNRKSVAKPLVLDLSGLKLFSTANSHAQDIDKRILLDFGLARFGRR